jgi:diphosphomevalonate decarboxylase
MQKKLIKSVAISHPNIAFIKYWGNADHQSRIPLSGSLSMNLEGLETKTSVEFDSSLKEDFLRLNGTPMTGNPLMRVSNILNQVRDIAGIIEKATVTSTNNFPTGSGIASSASAFSALALAASNAAGLSLDEKSLSILARTESGSASRSIPSGYVEWFAGDAHGNSYAASIAPISHWDLSDNVAIISNEHKTVGSTGGHKIAHTSPLQDARIADAQRRLDICRSALMDKDFTKFAKIVELDSNIMHSVMMTSNPNLFYWEPATIDVMKSVIEWRNEGLDVCYTIDAGPNVHVISPRNIHTEIKNRLASIPGVQHVITGHVGGPAKII